MTNGEQVRPVPAGDWRSDDMFKEFSCYGQTSVLDDPRSSGCNVIGGGGTLPHPDCDEDEEERDDRAVILYLQELDSGGETETRMTPDAARRLAGLLNQWADDAEEGATTVDEAIEKERAAWYAQGGLVGA